MRRSRESNRPDPNVWKRGRRDSTETARRTIYDALNGGWRVIVSRSLFGLPSRVYAIQRLPGGGEVILSRHRLLCPALRACEKAMSQRPLGTF